MSNCSELFNIINDSFEISAREPGEFKSMKLSGMNFKLDCFNAKEAGAFSFLTAKGFLGLMKMESLVFMPINKDAPLLSVDAVTVAGKCSLYLELYDTTLTHPSFAKMDTVRDKYAQLSDLPVGEHWYDSIKLSQSIYKKGKAAPEYFAAAKDYLTEYIKLLKTCPDCNPAEKCAENDKYVRGLLENGGPAVDTFLKKIGPEKTAEFMGKFMYYKQL